MKPRKASNCNPPSPPPAKPTSVAAKTPAVTVLPPKHCAAVLCGGLELYQIDTLVDLINLVSLRTGYSIGGFDADKIQGDSLELGIGRAEEPFEGIGRGTLNIEGLPVYRDRAGGIGTPTSDNERTKMGLETRRILAIVNGYNGREGLAEAAGMIQELLRKYADSDGETILYFE